MTTRRLPNLSLLATLAIAVLTLAACNSDDAEGSGGGGSIEGLPADARVVAPEGRTVEDAEEFLGMLSFEPIYPSELPDGFDLSHATITPSPFARDGEDPLADLSLEYTNEEEAFITVTQRMQEEMDEHSGAPMEEVQVGGAAGLLIEFGPEAQRLVWHDCGLALSLTASAYDGEELIAIGESMTGAC